MNIEQSNSVNGLSICICISYQFLIFQKAFDTVENPITIQHITASRFMLQEGHAEVGHGDRRGARMEDMGRRRRREITMAMRW